MRCLILVVLSVFLFTGCKGNAQNSSHQFQIKKTNKEWKAELTAEEYSVMIEGGTEPAFTSPLLKIDEPGTFACAACGNKLFKTNRKFHSGTGWPSFDKTLPGGIVISVHRSFGNVTAREALCAKCGAHIGHLFFDGPQETTGKRYCTDGVALNFTPKK